MPETFADLLRGQSQAKIARAIGESRALVNTWARGKSVPQVRHLPKLSKILRVDIGKLANVIAHDAQTESRSTGNGTAA